MRQKKEFFDRITYNNRKVVRGSILGRSQVKTEASPDRQKEESQMRIWHRQKKFTTKAKDINNVKSGKEKLLQMSLLKVENQAQKQRTNKNNDEEFDPGSG